LMEPLDHRAQLLINRRRSEVFNPALATTFIKQ